jgi:signal transduction histidine kinase
MALSDASWFVVLRRDGVVVEVGGGAPRAWVGHLLGEVATAPPVLRAHARELVTRAHEATTTEAWLTREVIAVGAGQPLVELLLLEAVPLRRAPTAVFDLLTRTTETLMEQARATEVLLKIEADRAMPARLTVDAEKIAWGVSTLVGSAMRHVGAAGGAKPGDRVVKLGARYDPKEREVVISVSDNGPGIPSEKLEWLIERNPTTQRAAGLALLLLHDVVVAHGGRMRVESSVAHADHGTRVTLYLPALPAPPSLPSIDA